MTSWWRSGRGSTVHSSQAGSRKRGQGEAAGPAPGSHVPPAGTRLGRAPVPQSLAVSHASVKHPFRLHLRRRTFGTFVSTVQLRDDLAGQQVRPGNPAGLPPRRLRPLWLASAPLEPSSSALSREKAASFSRGASGVPISGATSSLTCISLRLALPLAAAGSDPAIVLCSLLGLALLSYTNS